MKRRDALRWLFKGGAAVLTNGGGVGEAAARIVTAPGMVIPTGSLGASLRDLQENGEAIQSLLPSSLFHPMAQAQNWSAVRLHLAEAGQRFSLLIGQRNDMVGALGWHTEITDLIAFEEHHYLAYFQKMLHLVAEAGAHLPVSMVEKTLGSIQKCLPYGTEDMLRSVSVEEFGFGLIHLDDAASQSVKSGMIQFYRDRIGLPRDALLRQHGVDAEHWTNLLDLFPGEPNLGAIVRHFQNDAMSHLEAGLDNFLGQADSEGVLSKKLIGECERFFKDLQSLVPESMRMQTDMFDDWRDELQIHLRWQHEDTRHRPPSEIALDRYVLKGRSVAEYLDERLKHRQGLLPSESGYGNDVY